MHMLNVCAARVTAYKLTLNYNMSLCMHTYMYTCTHMHTHAHTQTHMHTHKYACTHLTNIMRTQYIVHIYTCTWTSTCHSKHSLNFQVLFFLPWSIAPMTFDPKRDRSRQEGEGLEIEAISKHGAQDRFRGCNDEVVRWQPPQGQYSWQAHQDSLNRWYLVFTLWACVHVHSTYTALQMNTRDMHTLQKNCCCGNSFCTLHLWIPVHTCTVCTTYNVYVQCIHSTCKRDFVQLPCSGAERLTL